MRVCNFFTVKVALIREGGMAKRGVAKTFRRDGEKKFGRFVAATPDE